MENIGQELRAIHDELDVKPVVVCAEAKISTTTLYSVFNGNCQNPKTVGKVRQAYERLRQRTQNSQAS